MCVATMTGRADAQTRLDDAALDDGQFFVGDFRCQIAARHHDAVGFVDDGIQILDRLLVLDLGDDKRMRLGLPRTVP